MLIAVGKWLGMLAPTMLFGWLAGSVFILGVGILCSVVDLAYIGLLGWNPLGRQLSPDPDLTRLESAPRSRALSSRGSTS